jgi:hypothetical protein
MTKVNIAQQISDRLRELGFDPHVAVAEQTFQGGRRTFSNRRERPIS